MLTSKQAARLIDISAVRTPHNINDIKELVKYAKEYRFINVHVLPNWVRQLADMLSGESDIFVGAPVGFPSGGHTTKIKLAEVDALIADGVQEMDAVMNVGRFLNEEYDYVLDELKQVVDATPDNVLTKIIIEINLLSDEEMLRACELVIESGADFVKSGTGWIPGGANIERIRKMKGVCGSKIKIKAAGGIRTPQELQELYDMGVERAGINTKSALEIVEYFKAHE